MYDSSYVTDSLLSFWHKNLFLKYFSVKCHCFKYRVYIRLEFALLIYKWYLLMCAEGNLVFVTASNLLQAENWIQWLQLDNWTAAQCKSTSFYSFKRYFSSNMSCNERVGVEWPSWGWRGLHLSGEGKLVFKN